MTPRDSMKAGLYAGYNYCQSHMFWWMLTVKPVYKLLNVSDHLKYILNQ